MADDQVFFEWKNKTEDLIEENTTVLNENTRITPLEYLMNLIITQLKENE